ncbi:MAG: FHA domain-containing protein [Pyrinomonadaceae bacterium]
MQNAPQTTKKGISADWLVRGVLTKIGDIFDRLTGRGYKPSSSLATSELIERLKFLMDSEAENENGRLFVPHNIKLKMQWDKFSTDAEESLRALENEFLIAAVDHINDKRYYTKAPLHVEAKPDYFTKGVKLYVSFDKFDDDDEAGISVAVPGESDKTLESIDIPAELLEQTIAVQYSFGGNPFHKELKIKQGDRLSVGRTKENHLAIDDPSISKYHASLALDGEGNIRLADLGSTNGTFINGNRIAYGKAIIITERDKLRFGLVDASIKVPPKRMTQGATEVLSGVPEIPKTESYTVGDLEFTKRVENELPATEAAISVEKALLASPAAPTIASIEVPKNGRDSVAEQPPVTASSIELKKEDEIEIP